MKTLYDVVKAWKKLQDREKLVSLIATTAPELCAGERPMPSMTDWPNCDADEVVAWTDTQVFFVDTYSQEFHIMPRMQEDEMRGLIANAAEIVEMALVYHGVVLSKPENMTLTQQAYWSMGVIKNWNDAHDDDA